MLLRRLQLLLLVLVLPLRLANTDGNCVNTKPLRQSLEERKRVLVVVERKKERKNQEKRAKGDE